LPDDAVFKFVALVLVYCYDFVFLYFAVLDFNGELFDLLILVLQCGFELYSSGFGLFGFGLGRLLGSAVLLLLQSVDDAVSVFDLLPQLLYLFV
jgi:hypothetical protein